MPAEPLDIYFFYAGIFLFAVLLLFMGRRPPQGMRLRLKSGRGEAQKPPALEGSKKPVVNDGTLAFKKPAAVERPLNVMFNYNGHSWDAYEVLGLPAGSGTDSAEAAYKKSVAAVDAESREFIESAYRAIMAQWHAYNKASGN